MASETDFHLLKICIGQILLVNKFNKTKNSAFILLSNICEYFIKRCAMLTKRISENSYKTDPDIYDLLLSLKMMDITPEGLLEFMKENESFKFMLEGIPNYPIPSESILEPYDIDEKALNPQILEDEKQEIQVNESANFEQVETEKENDKSQNEKSNIIFVVNEHHETIDQKLDSPSQQQMVIVEGLKLKFMVKEEDLIFPVNEEIYERNNGPVVDDIQLNLFEEPQKVLTPPEVKLEQPLPLAIESDMNPEICPICKINDDQNMIQCDNCYIWYHWACAQITVFPSEEESWFCTKCSLSNSEKLNENVKSTVMNNETQNS